MSGIGRLEVLLTRAEKARAEENLDLTIELYRRILSIDPTHVDAINGLGEAAGNKGDLRVAMQQFENSLRIEPRQPVIWFNHARGLARVGLTQDALSSLDRAIALWPEYAMAHLERATTLANLGRYEEALAGYAETERLLPNNSVVAKQRGLSLQFLGHHDLALKEFDRAIALDPEHADAWISKAMLLLQLGDLPNGFTLYEWRWRMAGWLDSPRRLKREYTTQLWLGEPDLPGKTLLVYGEQGLGDTIQFCRYANLAAQAGARVILEVPKSLTTLMTTLDGPSHVLSDEDPRPDHDLRCPVMSLPLAFGLTMRTIPADGPYLRADPVLRSAWRERLSALRGCRVGLVWGAGTRVGDSELVAIEHRKSLPLMALAPLASVMGCTFVSLQLGVAATQTASPPEGMVLHDHTGELKDFADTAALMDNLDLVISVCTSTAHLAGALGKPVWLLNRFDADWRWFLDREDSPWYPTMRLFRQSKPGDWASVVQSVTGALRDFTAAPRR